MRRTRPTGVLVSFLVLLALGAAAPDTRAEEVHREELRHLARRAFDALKSGSDEALATLLLDPVPGQHVLETEIERQIAEAPETRRTAIRAHVDQQGGYLQMARSRHAEGAALLARTRASVPWDEALLVGVDESTVDVQTAGPHPTASFGFLVRTPGSLHRLSGRAIRVEGRWVLPDGVLHTGSFTADAAPAEASRTARIEEQLAAVATALEQARRANADLLDRQAFLQQESSRALGDLQSARNRVEQLEMRAAQRERLYAAEVEALERQIEALRGR